MDFKFNVNKLPLEALILLEASKKKVNISKSNETCLSVDDNVRFTSDISAMRYLANIDTTHKWMGSNALERCEINHWVTYSVGKLSNKDGFKDAMIYLDKVIAPVTYLVGNKCTLADIVVWSKLFNTPKWIDLLQSEKAPINIARWYSFIASIDYVKETLTKISSLTDPSYIAQKEFVKKEKSDVTVLETGRKEEGKFVDLPGAEMGKVVVRFPPEASGYLHIGHAKAALLNQYYKEAFKGKLIMRFDDTNPAKEKEDFERVILEDLKLLKVNYDQLTRTSNYFEEMLKMCEKLIKDGKAYVDDTNAEEMKKEREKKICSKNRDNSVEKNMLLWNEMKNGTEQGQMCCVRAKIDMNSLNGCMRDPTIYRCKNEPHPQTGNKYKVYPTYDFACPIVDSLEGVTHCLRTMEYHDRDEQFYWFIDALGLRKPHIWEYSRLNMTNTVLSKRKLTWFVENKYVSDWDDPRMPTVRGVLRRGMTVEGLRQFIIAQGSSRSVVLMEWDKIWAINKKVIDPIAPRYTTVEAVRKVAVKVQNIPNESSMQVPKHPKNSEVGDKTIWVAPTLFIDEADAIEFKENENVTFINWGNLIVNKIVRDQNKIVEISVTPNIEDKNYKKTMKITWLADAQSGGPLIPVVCYYFDHIISKAILGKDEDFKMYINQKSMYKLDMLGEPELANVKKSDIIQLQRKGFFICDQPYSPPSKHSFKINPLVLIYIPDGHSKGLPSGLTGKENANTSTTKRNLPDIIHAYKEQSKLVNSLQTNKRDSSEFNEEFQKLIALKEDLEVTFNQGTVQIIDEAPDDKLNGSNDLLRNIADVGDQIRKLKAEKADKKIIQENVTKLLNLKSAYKTATGQEWKPGLLENKDEKTPLKNEPFANSLSLAITDMGNKIRNLKAAGADKALIDPEVKCLLKLKADYKSLTGKDWEPENKDASNIDVNELSKLIAALGDKIRTLKAKKADKNVVEEEVKLLLQLKSKYKSLTGKDWQPEQKGAKDSEDDLLIKIKSQGDKVRKLKSDKTEKAIIDEEVKILLTLKSEFKSLTGKDWSPNLQPQTKENSKISLSINKTESQGDGVDNCETLLLNKIKAQGDKIRQLKSNKAEKAVIDEEVKILLTLKSDYKNLTGKDWSPNIQPKVKENPDALLLTNKIKDQGNIVRSMKSNSNTNKEELGEAIALLVNLKSQYKSLVGQEFPSEGKSQSSNKKNKTGDEKGKNIQQQKSKLPKEDNKSDTTLKKITRLGLEAKKEENLPEWYSQIIVKSELIEYYDISGCYILRPWSYAIWESIKEYIDDSIKKMGVKNCYFPIFVSKTVLEKEKTHIADFAPEVAWVTKSGESDLAEPIAVRPTSETVMYPAYAKWIQSYRDLPIKLNQWNNVVRWEFKHPQPFLRTREFLWQEGHTAFATYVEAATEVDEILELYSSVYTDLLAIPVIKGRKTEKEKFAGGDYTLTVEAYISASGRAIQGATSHHLGQNFSKMFEIIYEDPNTQEKKFVYQNSWGITTRTIGVLIMVHADNNGLVLPPRVASIQVVIIPCGITASLPEKDKEMLLAICKRTCDNLQDNDIRCFLDERDNYSPGWKFNHWELKGVPIRIEIGPKDMQQQQIVAVRRDNGQKITIPSKNLISEIGTLLATIQSNLLSKATAELNKHKVICKDWSLFCKLLENKSILLSPFCGQTECEDKIKEDSARNDAEVDTNAPSMGAKSLCIPFQQPSPVLPTDRCIHPACNAKPLFYTLFGRSY